jgi:hypothetical protein
MYVVPIVSVVIGFQIEKEGELSSSSMSNLGSWFKWTGEDQPRQNTEFLPKRSWYDVCQNVSCPAMCQKPNNNFIV